ncbi:acyltransferase family protein [Granulicella sibirica]|uniref:Putative lipopolysaccharide modification acyltransferase n=1 Tax=Granulicella sibirica TaxID=2479048 RepID=A0A4Q0T590_9BACT|nr:acyltransferase [Granulicella sibirica]RXH58905.1 putative lipopolysaccharide modification acyltransferase [Granulicella sibirica]
MTPNEASGPVTPRFAGVDLLRGLSILSVVLLHLWLRMYFAGFQLDQHILPRLQYILFRNGGNGVTLFFAVSGFLITLTSLRRFGGLENMRPATFYRIRFARIAPLLLSLLAILSVLHLTHAAGFRVKGTTLPLALFSAFTFHLNWLEAIKMHSYLPANWDVLWSLSVEEMFYVFFPLVCLLAFRLPRGRWIFLTILTTFIILGPLARSVLPANDMWRDTSYLASMDGIALGCLTALLTNHLAKRPIRPALLIALNVIGAATILWIIIWPRYTWMRPFGRSGIAESTLALGACLIMFATVLRPRRGRPWTAPIRWYGRHSYEVYLTHEFLIVWGTMLYAKIHRGPLLLWFLAIPLLTAPLGWLTARYLSEPMNRRLRGAAPPGSTV